MWVRVGLVVGRVLLRLLIRLTPFLMVGLAALVRKYRWPIYYRALGLKPARFNIGIIPKIVLGSIGGVVALAIVLFLVVTHLSPHA
jgi:hypothetical protein